MGPAYIQREGITKSLGYQEAEIVRDLSKVCLQQYVCTKKEKKNYMLVVK